MKNWDSDLIKNILKIQRGFAFKSSDYSEDGVFVLRVSNLDSGAIDLGNAVYISKKIAPLYEKYRLNEGDILLVMVGATTGKMARVQNSILPALLNQNLWNLKPDLNRLNQPFFYYQSRFVVDKFMDRSQGSARDFLKQSDFSNERIFFPVDLIEQSKIAKILSTIDDSIKLTEKIVGKYERIKAGLMQDLLTNGIDENGNIRSEETHVFKDSKLGRVPKEWKESTIGKSVNICNQFRLPLSEIVREGMKGSYPYYGPTGILDYINEYRVEGKFVLIGEDGDHFLKFRKQEMTIMVEGTFNVNNHAHILQGSDECLTEWVHEYFMNRDITAHLTRQGAGRYKLNKAALKDLKIPLPNPTEQERIIDRTSSIRNYIVELHSEKEKLQRIKNGLMQDLLSGKVRVNEPIKENAIAL